MTSNWAARAAAFLRASAPEPIAVTDLEEVSSVSSVGVVGVSSFFDGPQGALSAGSQPIPATSAPRVDPPTERSVPISWARRADKVLAKTQSQGTVKTDKTPLSSVLSVGGMCFSGSVDGERPGVHPVGDAFADYATGPSTLTAVGADRSTALFPKIASLGTDETDETPPSLLSSAGPPDPTSPSRSTSEKAFGLPGPYRLPADLMAAAHAECWTGDAVRFFNFRSARFVEQGFCQHDAEDLAERMHLRDVTADDRRSCIECRHLVRWRCERHRKALLASSVVSRELAVLLQRCPAFEVTK